MPKEEQNWLYRAIFSQKHQLMQRFRRENFPKKPTKQRHHFSWGAVSVYPLTPPKVAVVVSKKVLKNATDRNRARRRVYGAMSDALKSKALEKSFVFFLKHEALTAPVQQLQKDIASVV